MSRHIERKLRVYAAAASAASVVGAVGARGALVSGTYTHQLGGGASGDTYLQTAAGNEFLDIGDDSITNYQGTDGNSHNGEHLYLTNKGFNPKGAYLTNDTNMNGSGTLENLVIGTTFGGPTNIMPNGLIYDNGLTGTDNDIAYVDSSSGTTFTWQNNSSGAPDQFSVGTMGYFGFSVTPTNSSTLDYGYASIIFDARGDVAGSYVYDDTGAAVTVAPFTGTSAWFNSGSGDYENAANWTNGEPNGPGAEADFTNFATSSPTVNLSTAVTLGTIRFNNETNYYTISGSGSITMQSGAGSGPTLISVEEGYHAIGVPLTFASSGTINEFAGTGLNITAPVTVNSGQSLLVDIDNNSAGVAGGVAFTALNVSSGANVTFNYNYASGSQYIAVSSLSLGANASANITATPGTGKLLLQLGGISMAPTSKLDIGPGALDIQNSPSLAAITALVAQGYNGGTAGAWSGSSGITSSAAAADSTHLTAVGVILNTVDGSDPLYGGSLGLFEGVYPNATDVLVKYTYYGDANLDGQVDASDYSLIDNGYLNGLSGWYNGDFNYDGVINGSDYTLIDNAFNMQGAQISDSIDAAVSTEIAGATSAVPEPASLGLIALGAVGLLRRKRA